MRFWINFGPRPAYHYDEMTDDVDFYNIPKYKLILENL
jgi:hypothetical protein